MFDLATERDNARQEIDYPRVACGSAGLLGWYFVGFFCTFDVELIEGTHLSLRFSLGIPNITGLSNILKLNFSLTTSLHLSDYIT